MTAPSKTTEETRVLPIPCALARGRANAVLTDVVDAIERRDEGVWATRSTHGEWGHTIEVRLDPEGGETRVRVRVETTSQPTVSTQRPYWTLLMLPALLLTGFALKLGRLGASASPVFVALAVFAVIAVSVVSRKRAALQASEAEVWLERARAMRQADEHERQRFATGVLDAVEHALAEPLDAPHYRVAPDGADTSLDDAVERFEAAGQKR